jgi:hypothetical protein
MKSKKFLFGVVVVLLMMTSVLPGCNEELPPVEADKLVIPSSLEPKEVLIEITNAGPLIQIFLYFAGGWTAKDIYPPDIQGGACKEQFDEGFDAALLESLYIKRDGKPAGFRDFKLVSYIAILKYEDTESAERSLINISETQEFQNLTYEGIDLKNGTHTLDPWWEQYDYWDESTMPCYLIHSGCFVIYFYGRQDVLNDMLDRIIVAFGVKE